MAAILETMTQDQESHLLRVKESLSAAVDAKYRHGQREHGGDLWRKKGLIDMAIDEAIDQVVYLLTLKQQLEEKGVELGSVDE